jgi:hypothetical protein
LATRSKALDQLFLLLAAMAFTVVGYWLWSFMEHHGIPDRMGFFIAMNLTEVFILTWQGVAFFRRTPGFWLFHSYWVLVHILIYVAWGHSGNRIELCVVTLPLEAYWYWYIARNRLLRSLEASRRPGKDLV